MCWDVKQGYSAVRGMLAGPKQERRPDLFYFGELASVEACQAACSYEAACAAFTWMGASTDGGWMGGNRKWDMQCYGRGAQAMTIVPEKKRVAGIKVPCEQLEEMERSFGANPTGLQKVDDVVEEDRHAGLTRQSGSQRETVAHSRDDEGLGVGTATKEAGKSHFLVIESYVCTLRATHLKLTAKALG